MQEGITQDHYFFQIFKKKTLFLKFGQGPWGNYEKNDKA